MQCRTATAAHCTEKTEENGAVDCNFSVTGKTTWLVCHFCYSLSEIALFFSDSVANKSLFPFRYNHCHYSTILTKLANFLNQFQNLLLPYYRVWRSNNSSSPISENHSNVLQRLARLKTKKFQRRCRNFSSDSFKIPQTTTRYVGRRHKDVIYIRLFAGSRLSL